MVRILLLSILAITTVQVVVGQGCSADLTLNFTTCFANNLATCSGCNNSTVSPSTSGSFTCDSLTARACPTIKCCRACEATTFDYIQNCIVDPLSSIVGTCNLNCSAFPYGDTNVNNSEPCLSELGSWTSCLIKGSQNCSGCDVNATLGLFGSGLDTCGALENYFCNQVNCCDGCRTETQAYFSCLYTSKGNSYNCTSLGNCTVAPSAPTAPTSVISTSAPVSPGTTTPVTSNTPAPSASTPTTSPPSTAPAPLTPTAPNPTSSSAACSNETAALTHCFESNIFFCTKCVGVALNLSSTTSAPQSCQDANSLTCPLYTCCPKCSSEARGLFNCKIGGQSSLTNCVFNCGGSSISNNTSAAVVARTNTLWRVPVVTTFGLAIVMSLVVH